MFQKPLNLLLPAGPTMIGAKGRGKFLNSKGSRSLEKATFFEYFLNYFVKILQSNVNLYGRNQNIWKLCFKAKYKNQNGIKFKQSFSMFISFLFDIVT